MKHSFKTLLTLALALIAGNVWGEEVTKTYTLSDSDNGKEVTTGDVQWSIGSNAIVASSTNMKLTGTITVTLPAGATLTKVEITKSNTWGSGATITFATGTTTLNTFSGDGTFTLTSNKTNGVYTFTKSGTSSKNAWVKEIKVTFEAVAPTGPSITCADISNVSYEGVTSATTTATFANADGWTPSISAVDGTIVTSASISGTTITYSVSENTGTTDREGSFTIKLSKSGETDVTKVVKVSQSHLVVDYATLPFVYDGGKSNLPDGLSQSGLGSDYSSSPYLKFDGTNDYVVLKINEAPGELKFDIKGNSFSGGTFKVQTSVDGETYTDLKTYSGSEPANTTTTETFSNLSSDIRFIKWVYTNKSTGNVALGKINLAKAVVVDYWVVKYDANGGEGAPDDVQVTKGESTTVSSTEPTRDGYNFAGWTTTKNGEDVVSGTYTPSENVTLYAKWTAKDIELKASAPDGGTYTVKIGDADAVTITSAQTLTAKAGTTIVMTSTASEGYKVQSIPFDVKDGNNEEVKVSKSGDNYSFTMPGSATTIAAKYSKLYTITTATCTNGSITKIADKDGNEIASASMNSKVVVTATPDAGYKVSKLYYVEEGSTAENDFTEAGYFSMPEKNVTIYAEFEESHDLVFDFNIGASIPGWPTSSSDSEQGEKTYNLNGSDYTFVLGRVYNFHYTYDTYPEFYSAFINKGSYLGLPAIEDCKLTKVIVKNTPSCSANTKVSITDGTNVVTGGTAQTWSKKASTYTYSLSGTEINTSYYLEVAEANAQILSLTLTYEPVIKSYDATITTAGWATLYMDFAAAIPEGVTAYTAVAGEDAVTLTEIEDVIPAETAVVLEGAAGTYTFEEATTTATAPANNLVGTLVATDYDAVHAVNAGKTIYVLGEKDGTVAFYQLSTTGTIKANSAYLLLDSALGSIVIRKDDATQVETVVRTEDAVIYDLLGRRVSEPMRGIYIVNGKKMFIK